MNSLMKHVLTIYSKYTPPFEGHIMPTDQWQKTVLKYGLFEPRIDKNFNGDGKTLIDKHIDVTIPLDVEAGGRKYLPQIEFDNSEEKENYWTVRIGDLIAKGETPDITPTYKEQDLKRFYPVCTVSAVEDLTDGLLPHIEVSGV